jgi:SpoVK/Ycf46/Vps4 family AAA+-type ATPase
MTKLFESAKQHATAESWIDEMKNWAAARGKKNPRSR